MALGGDALTGLPLDQDDTKIIGDNYSNIFLNKNIWKVREFLMNIIISIYPAVGAWRHVLMSLP